MKTSRQCTNFIVWNCSSFQVMNVITLFSDCLFHSDINLHHPVSYSINCWEYQHKFTTCVCQGWVSSLWLNSGAQGICRYVARSNLTVIPCFLKLYDGEQPVYHGRVRVNLALSQAISGEHAWKMG